MTDLDGWAATLAAVTESQTADRAAADRLLRERWAEAPADDHGQRCVIAHYLADLQPDLGAEICWDERALASYAAVATRDLELVGIPDAAGLAPSLHLNLGDGYLRAGRVVEAAEQLSRGLAVSGALGADGYGAMIRDGLDRLGRRIEEASSGGDGPRLSDED